jgi:hypothetical protein
MVIHNLIFSNFLFLLRLYLNYNYPGCITFDVFTLVNFRSSILTLCVPYFDEE